MSRKSFLVLSLLAVTSLVFSGCATTRAKKPSQADLQTQVTELQNAVQAKDQQIQDLQYQLQNTQMNSYSSNISYGKKSRFIRVSGVSVSDVQRALARAGYDPGPIDGQIGKKTKAAIKSFQRASGLSADGVVGDKTWSRLNR